VGYLRVCDFLDYRIDDRLTVQHIDIGHSTFNLYL
jgi:hypothetical protein